jgi:hypothetical protein
VGDPLAALRLEPGMVVMDEVQRAPDPFRTLRLSAALGLSGGSE